MRLALVGMFALSLIKGCDLTGGPEAVQQKFETALRPYFPNAQVTVDPQQHAVLGLTCIQGSGPELASKVGEMMADNPDLKLLKYSPFFGGGSYQYVGLAFDDSLIRLNVNTMETENVPLMDNYSSAYAKQCGFDKKNEMSKDVAAPINVSVGKDELTGRVVASASDDDEGGNVPYLWVGHFVVTLAKPVDGKTQLRYTDGLGIYTSTVDFNAHLAKELALREQFMHDDLAARNMQIVSVRLDSIQKMPVPEAMR